jgi:DNA-binding MarR family transcriptional regulator
MRRWLMLRLEPIGITYKQFQVLAALYEEDNVSQSALADRVNMDKTSLARMLERMEKAELIWRAVDPADSRVNRVNPTGQGRDLQGKVTPLRETGLSKATQRLSEEEVRELKRLLNHIYHNMSS